MALQKFYSITLLNVSILLAMETAQKIQKLRIRNIEFGFVSFPTHHGFPTQPVFLKLSTATLSSKWHTAQPVFSFLSVSNFLATKTFKNCLQIAGKIQTGKI